MSNPILYYTNNGGTGDVSWETLTNWNFSEDNTGANPDHIPWTDGGTSEWAWYGDHDLVDTTNGAGVIVQSTLGEQSGGGSSINITGVCDIPNITVNGYHFIGSGTYTGANLQFNGSEINGGTFTNSVYMNQGDVFGGTFTGDFYNGSGFLYGGSFDVDYFYNFTEANLAYGFGYSFHGTKNGSPYTGVWLYQNWSNGNWVSGLTSGYNGQYYTNGLADNTFNGLASDYYLDPTGVTQYFFLNGVFATGGYNGQYYTNGIADNTFTGLTWDYYYGSSPDYNGYGWCYFVNGVSGGQFTGGYNGVHYTRGFYFDNFTGIDSDLYFDPTGINPYCFVNGGAAAPDCNGDCGGSAVDLGCGCNNPADPGCGCGNPAPDTCNSCYGSCGNSCLYGICGCSDDYGCGCDIIGNSYTTSYDYFGNYCCTNTISADFFGNNLCAGYTGTCTDTTNACGEDTTGCLYHACNGSCTSSTPTLYPNCPQPSIQPSVLVSYKVGALPVPKNPNNPALKNVLLSQNTNFPLILQARASVSYKDGLYGKRYDLYFPFNGGANAFGTLARSTSNYPPHGDEEATVDFSHFSSSPDDEQYEYYSWQWLGYFKAPYTDTFTFSLVSDDYSQMWIGELAVSGFNDTNKFTSQFNSNSISLIGGQYYPIRIQFGEFSGADYITLSYSSSTESNVSNFQGKFYHKTQQDFIAANPI